jgi:homoserine O-acetyltransferase
MRMMLDGVPHLQVLVPDGPAADRFIAEAQHQAAPEDANDILYSLSSSADYDPRPGLAAIKTKVYALNFADDEFNPTETARSRRTGRFVVQPGSVQSFGHLTMAHPELWSEHVAEFMRFLGDEALRVQSQISARDADRVALCPPACYEATVDQNNIPNAMLLVLR